MSLSSECLAVTEIFEVLDNVQAALCTGEMGRVSRRNGLRRQTIRQEFNPVVLSHRMRGRRDSQDEFWTGDGWTAGSETECCRKPIHRTSFYIVQSHFRSYIQLPSPLYTFPQQAIYILLQQSPPHILSAYWTFFEIHQTASHHLENCRFFLDFQRTFYSQLHWSYICVFLSCLNSRHIKPGAIYCTL